MQNGNRFSPRERATGLADEVILKPPPFEGGVATASADGVVAPGKFFDRGVVLF